jgi:hypothetical protein
VANNNGQSSLVEVVTSTTAYTAQDTVGGLLTFGGCFRAGYCTSHLRSLTILDRANQKAAGQLVIFGGNPSGSTLTNDIQPTIVAADVSKVIARIPVAGADFVTIDQAGVDFAVAEIPNLGRILKDTQGGTTLWAIFQTTGTPTYAVVNGIAIRLGFEWV